MAIYVQEGQKWQEKKNNNTVSSKLIGELEL